MRQLIVILIFVLAIAVAGCGPSSFRKEVTETREVTPAPAAPAQSARDTELSWQLPESWTEAAPRPMRIATFAVAGNADIDCYVTSLSGKAGGVDANVDRWRGQLGLPTATAEELAQMPRFEMLGRQATLVEAAGQFEGMDGQARPGWMLLGAVVELDGQMLFVKMTGPEQSVRAEKDKFVRFCKSLKAAAK